MGCFWAYFLFSRPAQTILCIGVVVLLLHGRLGIAVLFAGLLAAGWATEWRMRTRDPLPAHGADTEGFTASEHVSRATAYLPWRREVKAFTMAPPAARFIAGELLGLALGIGVLLLLAGTLAWLGTLVH